VALTHLTSENISKGMTLKWKEQMARTERGPEFGRCRVRLTCSVCNLQGQRIMYPASEHMSISTGQSKTESKHRQVGAKRNHGIRYNQSDYIKKKAWVQIKTTHSQPHLNVNLTCTAKEPYQQWASRRACRATKRPAGGSGKWARAPPASGRMRSPGQSMCLWGNNQSEIRQLISVAQKKRILTSASEEQSPRIRFALHMNWRIVTW
jgi:hypothetical protein